MFTHYQEILSSSSIGQAIACYFTDHRNMNLILLKSRRLSIYNINQDKLELLDDFDLQGVATSCSVLRREPRDALLLTFSDAKMSVIEWSIEELQPSTISLHYYEREEFKMHATEFRPDPVSKMDPLSRCALVHFYQQYLAFLPFQEDKKSFVVKSTEVDPKIKHIKDFCFLDGYLEPTLAILYETKQGWVGRLGVLKDTCSLVVISLDLKQRKFPILFRVDGLPYNCTSLRPVPKPLGGILVLGDNALIYMDQTNTPGIACPVNGFFDGELYLQSAPGTDDQPPPPMKPQQPSIFTKLGRISDYTSLAISLDAANCVFLSPDILLLTLRNGDMIQVDLIGDDGIGRSWKRRRGGVKRFQLTVLGLRMMRVSSFCCLTDYSPRSQSTFGGQFTDETGAKFRYGYLFAGSQCADGLLIRYTECEEPGQTIEQDMEEDDELDPEIYGGAMKIVKTMEMPPIRYKIMDAVLVNGPIKDMTIGYPSIKTQFQFEQEHLSLEIVACSGDGTTGTLSVFQNTVRPNVLMSFALASVEAMWSVGLEGFDKYLFLSRKESTFVLLTGDDLDEMPNCPFYTSGPTLHVQVIEGSILQARYNGFTIYDMEIPNLQKIDIKSNLIAAYSNQLVIYRFQDQQLQHLMTMDDISLFALYDDQDCLLPLGSEIEKEFSVNYVENETKYMEIDEYDFLYGENETEKTDSVVPEQKQSVIQRRQFLVYIKDGNLYFVDLEQNSLVYTAQRVDLFPNILGLPLESVEPLNKIEEMLVASIGAQKNSLDFYLVLRSAKDDICIYKAYWYVSQLSDLAIRLKKIPFDVHTRIPQSEGEPLRQKQFLNSKRPKLALYRNIGKQDELLYSGVFVSGNYPIWIMIGHCGGKGPNLQVLKEESQILVQTPMPLAGKNKIRVHPMLVDGPVKFFCTFNNIHAPQGFCYLTLKSLRVAQLPHDFNYDNDWPVCKVRLERAAEKIGFHPPSETHVLASTDMEVFRFSRARYAAAVASGVIEQGMMLPLGDKVVGPDEEKSLRPGQYEPMIPKFQLQLVIELLEYEQVTSIQCVELVSSETQSGRKQYMAILVYDVIDVVPEPGRPQTNHKLKLFCKTDEKAPVTCLCAVNGCLLAAIGPKLIMYQVEEGELNGIAFLDVNLYVVSVSAVKNLILVSDVFKSCWFVVFQEEPPSLQALGKDFYRVQVFGSDFVVDDQSIGFVVTDAHKNLRVLSYSPYQPQSQNGQRLIRRGEMSSGALVSCFQMLRLRPHLEQEGWVPSKRYCTIGGSHDGAIIMVTPLSEKSFKRLYALYSRMVTQLQHLCGLNPRGFRHLSAPERYLNATSVVTGPPGPRGILDGNLISVFKNLPVNKQNDLAKAIGSRPERLLDDLLDLKISTSYF
ncbi:CPSF A subunit region-domain-containing protein [Gorgonomyces haynaldii]|nr:CPSF A subunit region-domain-containing protein [Gorgonomyces haynaldii]